MTTFQWFSISESTRIVDYIASLGTSSNIDITIIRDEVLIISDFPTYLNEIGAGIIGKAVTDTLYVSPNGDNTTGESWATAYNTIQAALDAAPTDVNDCTLIVISPGEYDINRTGNPTWTGNYILKGSHRNWVDIVNNHATATSIMRFTGKASLMDVTIDCGTGNNNGVIFSGTDANGARLDCVYIESENVTGANVGIELNGGIEYALFRDVMIHGEITRTKGLYLNNCELSVFRDLQIHTCLTGLHVANAASDSNEFVDLMLHTCTLGIDIDAGNMQMFEHVSFHGCTTNIDDEVGDHNYDHMEGEFPGIILPDDFNGVTLPIVGGGDTWGVDTEILAAAGRDRPFRVIGVSIEADATEKFRIRLSGDSATTHFTDFQIEGENNVNRRQVISLPSGTEFIFNRRTRISGSAKSESGGNNAKIWLEIQEI